MTEYKVGAFVPVHNVVQKMFDVFIITADTHLEACEKLKSLIPSADITYIVESENV
jgi:hypothetical protein